MVLSEARMYPCERLLVLCLVMRLYCEGSSPVLCWWCFKRMSDGLQSLDDVFLIHYWETAPIYEQLVASHEL